jgi:CHAD domain-containing protein
MTKPNSCASNPPSASATTHSKKRSLGDLAYSFLKFQFNRFREYEAAVRSRDDPEDLHQLRVALRKIRAALKFFREILPPEAQKFRQFLGTLGSFLGHARDADIQLMQWAELMGEYLPKYPEACLWYEKYLLQEKERWYQAMLAQLENPEVQQNLSDFNQFLTNTILSNQPADKAGKGLLQKAYQRNRKAGDALQKLSSPKQFHALRIACKNLRYALECFSPVYGKPARSFIKKLSKLQDLLGAYQDAVTASQKLEDLLKKHQEYLSQERLLSEMLKNIESQMEKLAILIPPKYERILGTSFPKFFKRL